MWNIEIRFNLRGGMVFLFLSQPQAGMSPLAQAAVTAYATPAEAMAYVKAASRDPGK